VLPVLHVLEIALRRVDRKSSHEFTANTVDSFRAA
jgi:hypothetical protein